MARTKERVLITRVDGHKQHYWKWIDSDEDENVYEYILNFEPTNREGTPSGYKAFEIRITSGDSSLSRRELQELGEQAVTKAFAYKPYPDADYMEDNYEMADSGTFVRGKVGKDIVQRDLGEYPRYAIVNKKGKMRTLEGILDE